MSAHIPIVPVVIRNAESMAPRHSATLHPSVVDVAVFPPLSVERWTAADLPDRIAQVRQLYVDTLTNWPATTVPNDDCDSESLATASWRDLEWLRGDTGPRS